LKLVYLGAKTKERFLSLCVSSVPDTQLIRESQKMIKSVQGVTTVTTTGISGGVGVSVTGF
jgi:hypothetical protein